jgi:hypothetical protein
MSEVVMQLPPDPVPISEPRWPIPAQRWRFCRGGPWRGDDSLSRGYLASQADLARREVGRHAIELIAEESLPGLPHPKLPPSCRFGIGR